MKKSLIFAIALTLSGSAFAGNLENLKSQSGLTMSDAQTILSETILPEVKSLAKAKGFINIKPQAYASYIQYSSENEARSVMDAMVAMLKHEGARLVIPALTKEENSNYSFIIGFVSSKKLHTLETASTFEDYGQAEKHMKTLLQAIAGERIVLAQVVSNDGAYSYHLAYFLK